MAKSYRRHSYRKRNDPAGLLVFILGISLLAYSYRNFLESIAPIIAIVFCVAVAIGIAFVSFRVIQAQKRKRLKLTVRYLQDEVTTMDGLDFEKYIADLLRKLGYKKVRLTERYDWGIDIIAYKDGLKWGVQVKRSSNMVKAAAVRQVFTALRKYKCDRAMVVTNATYSRPAKELALSNDCLLIDKTQLAEWLIQIEETNSSNL